MILPATPEETAELERDARRHRVRSIGVVVAVVLAALGLVLLLERPDGDDGDVAAATTALPPSTDTAATTPSEELTTAPADADAAAAPDAEPPADGPAPTTSQGVGAATLDTMGRFDTGHDVVRFSLESSGIVTVLDGSGTVLDGGTIVVDDDGPRSGAVVVPGLEAAVSVSIETDGAWEVTALPAAALPDLPAGGTIETAGTASFAVSAAATDELRVEVDGACADDLVDVELFSSTGAIGTTQVVGEGPVPVLADTVAVTLRSPCAWVVSG